MFNGDSEQCFTFVDAGDKSNSKTARRLYSEGDYNLRINELEASLHESQQQCAIIRTRLEEFESSVSAHSGRKKASEKDHKEECATHAMYCQSLEKSLEKRLHSVESEKQELQIRLSECAASCELRVRQVKTDSESETKRLTAVAEALKKELRYATHSAQELEEALILKERLLQAAQKECKNLQEQLADIKLVSDFKVKLLTKAASEAEAAEKQRAAAALLAAETRTDHAKISAGHEIQRCRSEAERLVAQLGEAKATINDYMWRCEAMQSSLAVANQNLASASETSAAAERRHLAELEASNIRAEAAQAKFDADIRLWRTEAERLQEALAESNATVDRFIEHSSNLQRRLDLSQVECFDLQKTFARISR